MQIQNTQQSVIGWKLSRTFHHSLYKCVLKDLHRPVNTGPLGSKDLLELSRSFSLCSCCALVRPFLFLLILKLSVYSTLVIPIPLLPI